MDKSLEKETDIMEMLSSLEVPPAATNLEYRILQAAELHTRKENARQNRKMPVFSWLEAFFPRRYALAYVSFALALAVLAALAVPSYLKQQEYDIAYQRYTVDGVPLLDDLALAQDPAADFDIDTL